MRKILLSALICSAPALAEDKIQSLQGSDTLAGFMSDLIVASGLEDKLVYQGGGSGKGEEAMAAGLQGLAAMSRPMKEDALKKSKAAGIEITEHFIGLDGIGIFVNQANSLKPLSLAEIHDIFTCKITNWKDLGGSDASIKVYRRNDASGTTDTFKSLVGVKEFGACVSILAETSDIAVATSTEANAVAYAGLSAARPGNHALSLSKETGAQAYAPTVSNIRSFAYPLARKLYIYEAKGSYTQTAAETQLMINIMDRSFADPLLVDAEFFTID